MEQELPQSRKGFQKLYGDPVKVKVYVKWKPAPGSTDKKPKFEPDPDTAVDAWMHHLSDDEIWNVEAVGVEAYRTFREKGAVHEDAIWKSDRVEKCQQLFYCLRTSDQEGAPRLFQTEGEVTRLFVQETGRLLSLYVETFIPTGDEIKNSFRERLGLPLETASSSPSTSATPVSSSRGGSGKKTRTSSRSSSGS
jgi:hypothetical protein